MGGMNDSKPSRRSFLRLLPLGALGAIVAARPAPLGAAVKHPEPREGIDGSKVLTREQLEGWPEEMIELFEGVAKIPHVVDGIGCACGCALMPNYRSLLTCYYETGMARGCPICQGEARLAIRRHAEGQSLERIRRAIDGRYG